MLEKDLKTFEKYVRSYDLDDKMIKIKYDHSLRVCKLCQNIANDLKLNLEDTKIAMLIGLLHDYSRFEQWTKYHSFNDKMTFDHGNKAVEILFDENEIAKYNLDQSSYQVVKDAIKNHNKFKIADDVEKENIVFCQIIRDADKIDILKVVGNQKLFSEDESEISPLLTESFFQKKQVEAPKEYSKSDYIANIFAYAFDLNYPYTVNYILENDLFTNIYNKIENKEKFKDYYEFAIKTLKERINKKC